jgi:DNA adenine methylase
VASAVARNVENFLLESRRNLLDKTRRMRRLEQWKWLLPERDILANLESALKSAFYMHLRYLYNLQREYNFAPVISSAFLIWSYTSRFRQGLF